jgi:MFS family permease
MQQQLWGKPMPNYRIQLNSSIRIIFRAFQGMGASGIYSLTMVLAPTLVSPSKFGTYMAVIATVFLFASVLGPVLGGAINEKGGERWRWVFLLK